MTSGWCTREKCLLRSGLLLFISHLSFSYVDTVSRFRWTPVIIWDEAFGHRKCYNNSYSAYYDLSRYILSRLVACLLIKILRFQNALWKEIWKVCTSIEKYQWMIWTMNIYLEGEYYYWRRLRLVSSFSKDTIRWF
jgi:hypothetical protein